MKSKNEVEPILLVDGHHGIYVPQLFCKVCGEEWGIKPENMCINPEYEDYWDNWCHILDTAKLTLDGVNYILLSADDLWAVEESYDGELWQF